MLEVGKKSGKLDGRGRVVDALSRLQRGFQVSPAASVIEEES